VAGSWDRRRLRWGLECGIGGARCEGDCVAWWWGLLVVRWGVCALDADVVGLVDVEVIVAFVVGGAGVAHATVGCSVGHGFLFR
jgi:hypothetical protein